MAISESIELLGKGLYKGTGIPDVLTLQALPTISELEYISSEDFDDTMIDKILPQVVKEKIDYAAFDDSFDYSPRKMISFFEKLLEN